MIKKTLFASVALLALAATSCDDNNDNNWDDDTYNIQTSCPVVVIPSSQSDEPYFVEEYNLRYAQYINSGKMKVTGMTPLTLSDGSSFRFETPEFNPGGTSQTIIADPLPFDADGKTVRLNSRCTNQYFVYDPGNNSISFVGPNAISVGTIRVGDSYTIKTFQKKCGFRGKTTTLINGDSPYATEEIFYEVEADLLNRKATVTMYNAKFAEAAPKIRILRIRNLSMTPDRSSGYRIEGAGLVPEVLEGNNWIPNNRFTFDRFTLVPTNENLSRASINYTVAGSYTGTCNGTYIVQ